ncbi:MAG TPA: acyl carrier protein [Noviherbaspirillum sp.]
MAEVLDLQLRELYVRALRLHVKPVDLPRENLLSCLDIDSVKAVEILINIETTFGIEIDPEQLSAGILDSFEGLARYVAAKQSALPV